ncbi:MAG: polynucleotide kinase-phosphatase [Planctomycetota bacterium]
MNIKLPNLSLVVLIGPSGSGKSTFAAKHFLPTEVLSSDVCRGLVSDDTNNQAATGDAFDVLNFVASKRLAAGRLTVIDATNVQPEARKSLVTLARKYHVLPVAIVLNVPEKVCTARNRDREDRNFGPHVIRNQRSQLRRSLRGLKREGFRNITILESPEQIGSVAIERVPLWNDKRDVHGPFDIIGDVHGCGDELEALLDELGYERCGVPEGSGRREESPDEDHHEDGFVASSTTIWSPLCYRHPEGRMAFFVGDLVDRGPRSVDVLSIVRNMVAAGTAMCVPGNHDVKLLRKLRGKSVQIKHGLAETLADIQRIDDSARPTFEQELAEFLDSLVSHYVVDGGKLVVAHAGMKEELQGRGSGKVREFALYGETTGETDEFGLPVRHNWAAEYRGDAMVVYGHTPVPEPQWLNKTLNIDTGCVFGGKLTALRYPELETVSVDAATTYCEPAKPFLGSGRGDEPNADGSLTSQQIADDLLDADDVLGKRIISTRLRPNITVREENATAALEIMSRFAVNPKWLIHLPPTMSPPEASSKDGFLEHPEEALAYFRSQKIPSVVCQEKHMGSRAIVVLCRDADAARERFGIEEGEVGVIVTRTGRRFFSDARIEAAMLRRLVSAIDGSGLWEDLQTSWICLDCELMPWSAKAQDLLRSQYAAVGAAARISVPAAVSALQVLSQRLDTEPKNAAAKILARLETTQANVDRFTQAYRNYCWEVAGVDDYKLAPFHVLATEGSVHVDKSHQWHMNTIAKIARRDTTLFKATQVCEVDLDDEQSIQRATDWWLSMTQSGGEGMVVKPAEYLARGKKGLVQPAIKCRGKEYLRIIYGPNYDSESNLKRLRNRQVGRKRSLAIRELALGIEALERFVRGEPLRKVHECAFGVLALESEPVDPRL